MARPERVADAIVTNSGGNVESRYKNYVLRPAYQPIFGFDADKGDWHLTGFEGLVRPFIKNNPVEVSEFFAAVDADDRLFIECMCAALHIRAYKAVKPENKTLFINIDVSKFPTVEALETEVFFMFSQLPKHNLNRDRVVFEILETEVLEKQVMVRICEMFRNNGFRFALDDFGTQHSNIERFLLVRPDIVKLDRTLFHNFCKVAETEKLIRALISAFRSNGSKILMEGIETQVEASLAADMQIDMMQGFGLQRPALVPAVFDAEISIPRRTRSNNLHVVENKGPEAVSQAL